MKVKLLAKWKMFLVNFKSMRSFCKICGCDIRDFIVDDALWAKVEQHIPKGHSLCYNCFCDICLNLGETCVYELHRPFNDYNIINKVLLLNNRIKKDKQSLESLLEEVNERGLYIDYTTVRKGDILRHTFGGIKHLCVKDLKCYLKKDSTIGVKYLCVNNDKAKNKQPFWVYGNFKVVGHNEDNNRR